MIDDRDTDTIPVSGFDETNPRLTGFALEDTAVIGLEAAYDDTLDFEELEQTDRVIRLRARTEPDWPPAPPPPQSRSRRHKAVFPAVTRPPTSS